MDKKRTILMIAGVAVLVGVLALFVLLRDDTSKYIQYKDPQLTLEQKQAIEGRITEVQNKIKQTDPKNTDELFKLYLTLASEYFPLGEYAKSRDNYLRAIDLKPDQPAPYNALATVEYAMADYKSALKHIDKALSLLPQDANYWRLKIDIAKKLEFTRVQVDSIFDAAIKAANNHVDITVHRAFYYEEMGDLPAAVAQWKRAMEIDPGRKAMFEQEIARIQLKLQ